MASAPIDGAGGTSTASGATSNSREATAAFGLGFEDLLKIVLTQLTYQDPLKPMDNFEFVSQLAQFAQIQQTQDMSDNLRTLVSAQSTAQATVLLGKTVDVPAGAATLTGTVTAITFTQSGPTITIRTSDNQTVSNINLGAVLQIREPN